ncbi:leucine-rich repeat domain-containing protein [Streptomyces sp. NRRL B-24720]|uniref:leucine-rich repeat domain-containing protein n=1 Tax=Streptomyces sp. NRRL B-24720 TaxID=1476876 RepID=UPI000A4337DE|nr:leucine-rich repeat domain-containing protein [Streptomyces sp. NRRL B-24720]
MTDEQLPAQVFPNRFPEAMDSRPGAPQDRCHCFDQVRVSPPGAATSFHAEIQDTSAPGWLRLLELIEEAAADGREEFRPLPELSPEERRQIVTLPASIGRLTAVRTLVLYGSNLVRIPPEIGDMTSLEECSPYTSHRLHWFPHEITRCGRLANSTVSTRSIYGNFKYRPPFPQLLPPGDTVLDLDSLAPFRWGTTAAHTSSVCTGPISATGPHQAWLSRVVATDVLPLLGNACSQACLDALPPGAKGYIPTLHRGGAIEQPPPR